MDNTERRRSRRFPLQQPALLRVCDSITIEVVGATENASLNGVFVCLDHPLPRDSWVEVTIPMRASAATHLVQLRGSGKVVRAEQRNGKHMVAIACDIPLTNR